MAFLSSTHLPFRVPDCSTGFRTVPSSLGQARLLQPALHSASRLWAHHPCLWVDDSLTLGGSPEHRFVRLPLPLRDSQGLLFVNWLKSRQLSQVSSWPPLIFAVSSIITCQDSSMLSRLLLRGPHCPSSTNPSPPRASSQLLSGHNSAAASPVPCFGGAP